MIAASIMIAIGVLIAAIGLSGVIVIAALDMQPGGWASRESLPFWGVAVVGLAIAAAPFMF